MIEVTADLVAAGHGVRLLHELEANFFDAGFPPDAAVYGDSDPSPIAKHYLNPRASEIAADLLARWGGVPCEDPGEPVALLIGHQAAYFSQNKSQTPR